MAEAPTASAQSGSSPVPVSSFDETYFDGSEFETRAGFEDSHYWHIHRRRVIHDALERIPGARDAPLLEVGCGTGFVATGLNRSGFRVDYADVHASGLALARRRAGEGSEGPSTRRFLCFDLTRSLPARGYRGVLLLDVLEHLPDHVGVLKNLREASSGPEDWLLITVPAFPFLWSEWDEIQRHKRRYTRKTLRAALDEAGWELERTTYFFLPLLPPAWTVKCARALRDRLAPARSDEPRQIQELIETSTPRALSRAILALLAPERWWLKRRALPYGTSLLGFARPRSRPS